MSQNLQNFVKFQKCQLENLVDFEKCCRTHIFLQNFVLIQPRTSPPKNLQNIAKFQKFQLENLVDFEKCCKTHIFLQKSEPIQPKTSNILPKFCRSAVVSPTGALAARRGRGGRCLPRAAPCAPPLRPFWPARLQ